MICCATHREALIADIRRKGMGRYIRHAAVHNHMVFARRWQDGEATAQEFNPFIVGLLEINKKMRDMGFRLQAGKCPLCYIQETFKAQHQQLDKAWIDNVTDVMLLFCKVNDLHTGDSGGGRIVVATTR